MIKMMIMIIIDDFDMPELLNLINSDSHITFGNQQTPYI